MRKILPILFILFILPVITFGANCGVSPDIYYVDYVGGNNANNGTSTSTPWKTAPGGTDSNLRPVPNCTLQPGDTVIFKGGVAYQDQLSLGYAAPVVVSIASSGSSGSPIVYDGDSGTYASRWAAGSDKAIIDGQSAAIRGFTLTGQRSYITINGFSIKDNWNVHPDTIAQDSNICLIGDEKTIDSGPSYITITNNDFLHGGIYDPILQEDGYYYPTGRCIQIYGGSYITISDNTMTECGSAGVLFNATQNSEISGNTFTGTQTWPIGVTYPTAYTTYTNIKIHDNTFYDLNIDGQPIGNGHTNWFYIYTPDITVDHITLTNFQIYNNTFYNTGTGLPNPGCPYIYLETNGSVDTWDGLYIFNNVFFNGFGAWAVNFSNRGSPYSIMKNVYYLNNSFYGTNGSIGYGGFGCVPEGQLDTYFINNILYSTTTSTGLMIPHTSTWGGTVDVWTNLYYTPNTSTPFQYNNNYCYAGCGVSPCFTNVNFATWQTWRVGTGNYFDASPHAGISGSDPKYVSVAVTNPATFNLALQSDSPAIGAGSNLTSLCSTISALCLDKDGKSRPASGAWDIGAYQSGSKRTIFRP